MLSIKHITYTSTVGLNKGLLSITNTLVQSERRTPLYKTLFMVTSGYNTEVELHTAPCMYVAVLFDKTTVS